MRRRLKRIESELKRWKQLIPQTTTSRKQRNSYRFDFREFTALTSYFKETLQMVPLIASKLNVAVKDLREFLEKNRETLNGTAELQLANEFIAASEGVKY
jgi:hypothetical protein